MSADLTIPVIFIKHSRKNIVKPPTKYEALPRFFKKTSRIIAGYVFYILFIFISVPHYNGLFHAE